MPYMLPTILKNLFSSPATRKYPFVERKAPPGARGHIVFDRNTCVYCGSCMRKCPAAAIEVDIKGKKLSFYPGRCIVCNACVEGCPKNSITLEPQWRKPFDKQPVESFQQEGTPDKPKAAPAESGKPPEGKAPPEPPSSENPGDEKKSGQQTE